MAWIENNPGTTDVFRGTDSIGLQERPVTGDHRAVRGNAGDSLRISEENLAHAQRIAKLGNFTIDMSLRKFTCSDELYRIFGYESDRDQFTFSEFRRIIHPDDAPGFTQAYCRAYASHKSLKTTIRIRRRDGNTRALYIEADYLLDQKGKPVELFGIVQDITELRRTEDALRESDTRFSVLANTTSCAISIIQDGRFVYANPALQDLIGHEISGIVGKPYLSFVHPDYIEVVIRDIYRRVLQGLTPPSREIKICCKNGTERWAEVHVGIIEYNGRMATIITAFDVTAYKQADEVIRASLREKELMLKEIHHRVKNNMQIISSLLSLQASHLDKADPIEAFKNSQNRVRSMAIIHEMLYQSEDLASIDFGTYLNKLLLNIFNTYQIDFSKVEIRARMNNVSLDIEKAIPCGLIINELLTNAFKYAYPESREGTIDVVLQKDETLGTCTLIISDDGVGLPPEIDLENIQTLGLQLVDTLVSQLSGMMLVDRTAGTRYTIEF